MVFNCIILSIFAVFLVFHSQNLKKKKGHVLYDFIYIKYHNRPIHRDNRLTVAGGKEKEAGNSY